MRPRPLQPLLFRQTAALAVVLGLAGSLWWQALLLFPLFPWIDTRLRRPARAGLCCGLVLLGFAWGLVRAPSLPDWDDGASRLDVAGTVAEVQGISGGLVRVVLDDVTGNGRAMKGRLVWTWDAPTVRPVVGQRGLVRARVRSSMGLRNDGDGAYWMRRGVFWKTYTSGDRGSPRFEGTGGAAARLAEGWRGRIVDLLRKAYPADDGADSSVDPPSPRSERTDGWGMIPALLFGDRSFFDDGQTDLLSRAGLAHSIALSGQHLAVTGLFAGLLAFIVGLARPGLWLRLPRQYAVLPVALAFAAVYLWIGGAPPSLWRAFLMMAFWTLFLFLDRPAAFPDAMLAALVCMAIADPSCLADVGAQMSFASVAAICLLASTLTGLIAGHGRRERSDGASAFGSILRAGLRFVMSLFACSLTVQVVTFPLMLSVFGCVTPFFLMNLVWLPVLGFWVLPAAFVGLLFVVLGWDGLAGMMLVGAVEPCRTLLGSLASLDAAGWLPQWVLPRPHWTGIVGWGCLVVAAAASLHRPLVPSAARRFALAGCVLMLCGPLLWAAGLFSDGVSLRLLDVGQGQSVLLELPGRRRMLVDAGGSFSDRFDTGRAVVAPTLALNAPLRLDILAASHADVDHAGGLPYIVRHFDVGQIVVPAGIPEDASVPWHRFLALARERGIPVRAVLAGDVIPLADGLSVDVLAPVSVMRRDRNDGLVLRLVRNGQGLALLPGDAGNGLLETLLRRRVPMRAKVYVAAHHGSAGSAGGRLLDAVGPDVVLASCGIGNRFSFPSRKLKDLCTNRGVPLMTTARLGALRIDF